VFPESLAEVVRMEGGRVVATLFRMTGDLDVAEDAFADAAIVAFERWPVDGIPERPGAWLTTVARRKALDHLRREARRQTLEQQASEALMATDPDPLPYHTVRDDQLRLIFTCCHPALARDAQVALALRVLCGLTTTEIARAFLTSDTTMGQRIARAKHKIKANRIGIGRVPRDAELSARLPGVLAVVHLVFTTGHHAPVGSELQRVDLADEGVRLARLLTGLMPDEAECLGLLALVESVHARRSTRLDAGGEAVLLRDADRSQWDHDAIVEASALLERALRLGRVGPYQVQAAISCLHSLAATADATDWVQIAELYGVLDGFGANPFVRVNRAVAVGEADGPDAGLAVLATAEGTDGWHFAHTVRADLLARSGRADEAAAALRAALACAPNDVDRRLLEARLAGLTGEPDAQGVHDHRR
jgi:RNA polymerase sigma-70 factor, ECF subfamily